MRTPQIKTKQPYNVLTYIRNARTIPEHLCTHKTHVQCTHKGGICSYRDSICFRVFKGVYVFRLYAVYTLRDTRINPTRKRGSEINTRCLTYRDRAINLG